MLVFLYWGAGLKACFPWLEGLEGGCYVLFDAVREIVARLLVEFESGDVLVELYVAVAYFLAVFVGHLRNLLSFLAHETVGDEPLAYEFLAELLLWKSFFEEFFVGVCVEVAA